MEFCITAPKWQRIFFYVFLAIGIAAVIGLTVFYFIDSSEPMIFLFALAVGFLFIGLAVLGLYVAHKEKFIFKDKLFTYVKPFKKSQSAHIDDIARVEIRRGGAIVFEIVFIGKDGATLINFLDDGTSLRHNQLVRALMFYEIAIVEK